MRCQSQLSDKQVDATKKRERENKFKSDVQKSAEENREDKSQDLVVGDRAAKHADGDETRAQQEKADVRTPDAATVEVADRQAETVNREIIDKGGNQGQQHQTDAGEEFGEDNLPVGQRLGEQHLDGARAVFLGKAAHGDSRNEEKEHPRRDDEKTVQIGIVRVQHIEIALEHPKEQSRDKQKHHDYHDAYQRTEEIAYFFLEKCKHDFVLIKSAKIVNNAQCGQSVADKFCRLPHRRPRFSEDACNGNRQGQTKKPAFQRADFEVPSRFELLSPVLQTDP